MKTEVAERWKRGAEGAEMNAEGVRIEGAEGEGNAEGVSPPKRLDGLGERRELPQRGPGQSPAENEFGDFCGR